MCQPDVPSCNDGQDDGQKQCSNGAGGLNCGGILALTQPRSELVPHLDRYTSSDFFSPLFASDVLNGQSRDGSLARRPMASWSFARTAKTRNWRAVLGVKRNGEPARADLLSVGRPYPLPRTCRVVQLRVMANCEVDDGAAGSYGDALVCGATRFCDAHPEEDWEISGVLVQHGLSLNASCGTRRLTAKVLPPVLDMEGCILETLEAFRSQGS